MGQLLHGNQAVEIEGLWALSFAPNATADDFKLYFTAGPDGEEHGVFGVLSRE